jgi:hypothetical protein
MIKGGGHISRKETASEYDKINNFAMIRRPFVTIEGQFLSVITVINMLHSFNQLIVRVTRRNPGE